MEYTFTFERNGSKNVLPFNPEIEGYMYAECKCAYVKFKKADGDTERQLNFYYKSDNKYVQSISLIRIGNVMRQLGNKIIKEYPQNQDELRSMISSL